MGSLPHKRLSGIDETEDDTTTLKLTKAKSAGFYVRAATLFLRGAEGKEAVDKIQLSALGEAMSSAVSVATRVQSDGVGKITKVLTRYPEMPNGGNCAHICIELQRQE